MDLKDLLGIGLALVMLGILYMISSMIHPGEVICGECVCIYDWELRPTAAGAVLVGKAHNISGEKIRYVSINADFFARDGTYIANYTDAENIPADYRWWWRMYYYGEKEIALVRDPKVGSCETWSEYWKEQERKEKEELHEKYPPVN